jgi:diguanylate cyclase (GGDEF)-like protein/PAS domain S-box-containing protein/putative nucleotidyltransferase with HDIG domain
VSSAPTKDVESPRGPNPGGRAAKGDSSRVLLGLLDLSQFAAESNPADNAALDGAIAPVVLKKLISALQFRDLATVMHSRRVAQLAVGMAEHLQWEGRHLKLLEVAALLHDVGKIGVPDNVLFKPGKLSPDEAELMATHLRVGVDILQACRADSAVTEFISQSRDFSHDAASSRGRNLASMHLGARILSVADAYDSLRSDQVYRRAKSHEETMKILIESAGTQFDINVVTALSRWQATDDFPTTLGYGNPASSPEKQRLVVNQAEAEEADSLERVFSYLYLLENLYDGFYLLDSNLEYIVWNAAAQRLLGHKAEKFLGQSWSSHQLPYADSSGRELADTELSIRKAAESRRAVATMVKVRHEDGHWIDIELQTVPLIDDAGRLRGVAEIFRDMSRRKDSPEYRDLRLAASRDSLTNVANRGELEAQLTQMLSEAAKNAWKEPCSAIFLDIDHFKSINDKFGHATGDLVLIELARLLQQETYSGEVVGRYGGEEFVILCPATAMDAAVKRAERIREAITNLEIEDLEDWPLTASFGVAEASAEDNQESFLRRADKSLYEAKNTGRNRTCFQASGGAAASPGGEAVVLSTTDEFSLKSSFHACTVSSMIVYKLGGFVTENKAELLKVDPTCVVMRLGRTGFFSGWGKTEDRQPVDMEIEFGKEVPAKEINGRQIKSNHVVVEVQIKAVGKPSSPEVFEFRAREVLKTLTTYFLARNSDGE